MVSPDKSLRLYTLGEWILHTCTRSRGRWARDNKKRLKQRDPLRQKKLKQAVFKSPRYDYIEVPAEVWEREKKKKEKERGGEEEDLGWGGEGTRGNQRGVSLCQGNRKILLLLLHLLHLLLGWHYTPFPGSPQLLRVTWWSHQLRGRKRDICT